jgi:hypothetical protein
MPNQIDALPPSPDWERFDTGASSCAITCSNAEQPCPPMRVERWASVHALGRYRQSISRLTTYARYFRDWHYRLTRLKESEYSTRVVGHRNADDEGVNGQGCNEAPLSRQSRSSPPQCEDTQHDVNDQEQYLRR